MKMSGIAAVVFKIFSEIQDQIINGTCIRINMIIPNGLQDFFPFYHFILVFDQAASGAWFLFY